MCWLIYLLLLQWLVVVCGTLCCRMSVHPVIANSLICFEDDIIPLTLSCQYSSPMEVGTDPNVQDSLVIRFNGNEIGGLNSHHMLVNPKLEMRIRGSVDKTHPMSFPRLEYKLWVLSTAVELISPVDETIICRRRGGWNFFCKELLKCCSVEEVCYRHGAEIDIPVCAWGTSDYNWTEDTVGVLEREMTVIPTCPITCRMESIGKWFAWRNWT